MRDYEVVGFVAISLGAAFFTRPRWDRAWFALTLAPLVALVALLILRQGRIVTKPPDAPEIAYLLGLLAILWLAFSQRGSRFAVRGLNWLAMQIARSRHRNFAFAERLSAVIRPLGRPLWARAPRWQDATWTPEDIEARQRVVKELEALEPPATEWGEVRDQYRQLILDEIETMTGGASDTEVQALRARAEALKSRVTELRAKYQLKWGRRPKPT